MKRAALLSVLLALPGILPACVALSGPNSEAPVIVGESAVIIWDEDRKIEHFIRQADILTSAPDVGFIVPTPETPELAEADPQIFWMAGVMAEPKHVPKVAYRTPMETIRVLFTDPFGIKAIFSTITGNLTMAASAGAVEIIQQKEVAGYHAVTLSADDATALSQWLTENGYSSNPAVEKWLKPYIANKWKITAFKLAKEPHENGTDRLLLSKAIRMSFPTERPFFPYSEPGNTAKPTADQPTTPPRLLNVAILSQARMSGALQDGHPWLGKLLYAGTSQPDSNPGYPHAPLYQSSQWLTFAGLDEAKNKPTIPRWLTCFRDDSNPRRGTSDLYFSPSAESAPMQRTVVDESLPVEYRLDWSDPLSDLEAGLIVLLIGGVLVGVPIWLYRLPKSPRKA